MNIAMFAWEALEGIAVGGGASYASRLACAMARAGHRVRLFTRQGPGQAMSEVVDGVRIRRCPWDRKNGFCDEIESLSRSFAHYFHDAFCLDGPYDVVHCHEWLTIEAGLLALEKNPARLAVSFHSTEWGRTGSWPEAGDSARIAGWERRGVELADAVVAVSHWAKRKLQEQFHPPDWKCEVIRHGTDFPDDSAREMARDFRAAAGLSASAPIALFAGRFSRSGGGDLAARACRIVARRLPGARFVFVGEGPLGDDMRREAGESALFLPLGGRSVPPELYEAADLILAPFRRDYSGRAVLPAWAASKPAAILSGTAPSEFVLPGKNGLVVEDEAERLADAVCSVFEDPDFAAWMGRNGRVAAETAFTWDASAEKLLGSYARRPALTPP